eukprot:scaffold48427_cov24-Tisochrysis_lutea.AAC.2
MVPLAPRVKGLNPAVRRPRPPRAGSSSPLPALCRPTLRAHPSSMSARRAWRIRSSACLRNGNANLGVTRMVVPSSSSHRSFRLVFRSLVLLTSLGSSRRFSLKTSRISPLRRERRLPPPPTAAPWLRRPPRGSPFPLCSAARPLSSAARPLSMARESPWPLGSAARPLSSAARPVSMKRESPMRRRLTVAALTVLGRQTSAALRYWPAASPTRAGRPRPPFRPRRGRCGARGSWRARHHLGHRVAQPYLEEEEGEG